MLGYGESIHAAAIGTLFLTAITVDPALAWGPEGHAIIAKIAQARLTPAAKAQVTQLLGQEGHQDLDQISS